jgi:N-acetylneuraminic acid mutarotase
VNNTDERKSHTKIKSKMSGHIIGSSASVLLFWFTLVALSSAFNSNSAPKPAAELKVLSFAERVTYQRAIEQVYWRHRIWPATNTDSKPPLDQVMSQVQIKKKVADYLRESQALEDYWQRPIAADQLQAEMERMASHTKRPEVLRDLFEALQKDPFTIAECLARPVLTKRLIADLSAQEDTGRFDSLRTADLQMPAKAAAIGSTRQASRVHVDRPYQLPIITSPSGSCVDDTWTPTTTSNAPIRRAVHTAIWTGSEMIVWGGLFDSPTGLNTGGRYDPATDSWTATSTTNAPSTRFRHTAVWTGSEMIVWGGNSSGGFFNTGGRYDPSTDSWTATTTIGAPSARFNHTAVWTGSEMIVWAGRANFGASYLNTGGRYDPSTDSWTATSTTNAPSARAFNAKVWTGSEMIVWGGAVNCTPCVYLSTGGRYDPAMDRWTATNPNAPSARVYPTGVWTGREMIIWGGDNELTWFDTGARYDPGADSWTATSTTNAPAGRAVHTAVWTGNEMIVWGGANLTGQNFDTGGKYCAQPGASPTPTVAATATATPTATASATSTPTPTPTTTATATPTATATATTTPTPTPTPGPRPAPAPRSRPTPAPRP